MTQPHMQDLIIHLIEEVIKEHAYPQTPLTSHTHILTETPLDSLDLAIIVVKLEEKTGKDPFKSGFIPFATIEELAKLYE